MEIKHKTSRAVLFAGDYTSLKLAVEAAVTDNVSLSGADLSGAYLRGADLSGAELTGAYLGGANLTGADLGGAELTGADLTGADLTGAELTGADLTGAELTGAYLRYANLSSANLGGANLTGAYLRYANLSSANLGGANLSSANLRYANLRSAYLRGANLRSANLRYANLGGAEIPIVPNIDSAILAAIEAGTKLNMTDWHRCETTHCRAGWAITLAGEAGAKLEKKVGSDIAGTLIYAKSRPDKPIPDFYASDEEALEDIRRNAAEETAAK